LEIPAPVFGFGLGEPRFDFGGLVDFKDHELGGMAAAFSFVGGAGFPTGARRAGIGGCYGCHKFGPFVVCLASEVGHCVSDEFQ
jgi:hypothetical protein